MPRIDPRQLDSYTVQLVDIYRNLEQEVFEKMAQLLKTDPTFDKEYALEWQVDKLRQLGLLNEETLKELATVTGIAREELAKQFNAIAEDTIFTVGSDIARATGETVNTQQQLTAVDELLNAVVDNVMDDLDNLVNARLINSPRGESVVISTFKRIIENTTTSAIVGNKTINQAVTETIIEFRNKGLSSGFVDKAGRVWNVQSYVDMVVRTTANQTYNQIAETQMKQYGVDLVLVDSYAGARPTCARIQGKVCSMSKPSSNPKYPSIYEFGYGKPDGIRGIHCRHKLYPFVDGVSTNNMNPPDVSKANEVYKQMQKQRSLERKIRAAKNDLRLAEITGDEKEIARTKQLVRNRQALVRMYVEKTGLPRRYDKERVI